MSRDWLSHVCVAVFLLTSIPGVNKRIGAENWITIETCDSACDFTAEVAECNYNIYGIKPIKMTKKMQFESITMTHHNQTFKI